MPSTPYVEHKKVIDGKTGRILESDDIFRDIGNKYKYNDFKEKNKQNILNGSNGVYKDLFLGIPLLISRKNNKPYFKYPPGTLSAGQISKLDCKIHDFIIDLLVDHSVGKIIRLNMNDLCAFSLKGQGSLYTENGKERQEKMNILDPFEFNNRFDNSSDKTKERYYKNEEDLHKLFHINDCWVDFQILKAIKEYRLSNGRIIDLFLELKDLKNGYYFKTGVEIRKTHEKSKEDIFFLRQEGISIIEVRICDLDLNDIENMSLNELFSNLLDWKYARIEWLYCKFYEDILESKYNLTLYPYIRNRSRRTITISNLNFVFNKIFNTNINYFTGKTLDKPIINETIGCEFDKNKLYSVNICVTDEKTGVKFSDRLIIKSILSDFIYFCEVNAIDFMEHSIKTNSLVLDYLKEYK